MRLEDPSLRKYPLGFKFIIGVFLLAFLFYLWSTFYFWGELIGYILLLGAVLHFFVLKGLYELKKWSLEIAIILAALNFIYFLFGYEGFTQSVWEKIIGLGISAFIFAYLFSSDKVKAMFKTSK